MTPQTRNDLIKLIEKLKAKEDFLSQWIKKNSSISKYLRRILNHKMISPTHNIIIVFNKKILSSFFPIYMEKKYLRIYKRNRTPYRIDLIF